MTNWIKASAMAAIMTLVGAPSVVADEIKPAVVYSLGDKFDKSFNEAAFNGATRFSQETGIAFRDFEITNEAQFLQIHRRFAERGHDPIVAVGFLQAKAVEEVASENPETRFTIIDSVVDLPNVRSVVFKEHEGSFLVGVLAALKAGDGAVGFVGGMDIPLIRKFACGYTQGARWARADVDVIRNMAGSTPAAWTDPGRGAELARGQFARGVEVVFAAAGTTGLGVLQAAADEREFSIGVDSNQNPLHPGSVLTSMVKGVSLATYTSLKRAKDGDWQPGVTALGLAEGGVGWARDVHNAPLITEMMAAKVAEAETKIISGDIKVHDYMSDNACPVW